MKDNMSNVKISTVLILAADLVLSRDGDVTTEDGDYATCGTDEMINLDCALAELLELPYDDVNCVDTDLIYRNAEKYDKLVEQVEKLRETLVCIKHRREVTDFCIDASIDKALEETC